MSGLTGTPVLQNNGREAITLTQNGEFAFAVLLPDMNTYSITTLDNPLSQNCIAANSSGILAGTPIVNVDVRCTNKSWVKPKSLNEAITPAGQHAAAPKVAMGGNGQTVVAWIQTGRLYIREYRGTGWKAALPIGDASTAVTDYSVGMAGNGDTVLVWIQNDASTACTASTPCPHVYLAEYRNGTWRLPQQLSDHISPADGLVIGSLGLTINRKGDALVYWVQDGVQISEYRDRVWNHPQHANERFSFQPTTGNLSDTVNQYLLSP